MSSIQLERVSEQGDQKKQIGFHENTDGKNHVWKKIAYRTGREKGRSRIISKKFQYL